MIPAFAAKFDERPSGFLRAPPRHQPAVRPTAVRLVRWQAPTARLTPAKRAGVRYEERFHRFARKLWGPSYRTYQGEIFAFQDLTGPRACRPDGVLLRGPFCIIMECKVHHTPDSFFQLRELYEPVLRKYFAGDIHNYMVIEVVRNFDPATPYPCRTQVLGAVDIEDYLSMPQPTNEVGVWVWKDK